MQKNFNKTDKRERENFEQWKIKEEYEQALRKAKVPVPPYTLRIGEPVVVIRHTKIGLISYLNIMYYRGVSKDGERLFSTLPIGKPTIIKKEDSVVRFSEFSPYNLMSNKDREIPTD